MVLFWLIFATYVCGIAILITSAIAGYKRGLFGSLVRTVYIVVISVVSGLIAYLISPSVTHAITTHITHPTIVSFFETTPETVLLVEAMITPILFSIIWTVLFGIFELVSMIKFTSVSEWIEEKATHHHSHHDKKGIGVAVGVFNGLISSAILLIPLCFVVTILNTADMEALQALHIPVDHQYQHAAHTPSEILLNFTTSVNNDQIPDEYSELRQTGLNMKDEATGILNAIGCAKTTYDDAKSHQKNQKELICMEIGAINAMSQTNPHAPATVPYIFANVIKAAANVWSQGGEFLGINMPIDNKMTQALVSSTLSVLKDVTPENAPSVIYTLMGDGHEIGVINNIFELQNKSSTYDSTADMLKDNDELIADTLIKLGESEDLHTINNAVNEIGQEYIQSAKDQLFNNEEISSEKKKETLEKLTDSVASYTNNQNKDDDAASDDETEEPTYQEQIENISQEIISTADEYNYPISSAEATIIAVGLTSYFESTDEITTEGLMQYFGFSEDEINAIINNSQ